MELQIISEKKNPLLKRREIAIKISNKGTPSRMDVRNKLAALANSKPELIVIERLDTIFGKQEIQGKASIYETDERLAQLAHQHLVVRGAPKAAEEKPAEAAPAAPVKEEAEARAETEQKEEAKAETKAGAKPKEEAKAEGKKQPEKK